MEDVSMSEKLSSRLFELEPRIRYVVIRYATQYQLLIPYKEGHVSIGVELEDDPGEIARRVAEHLQLPM